MHVYYVQTSIIQTKGIVLDLVTMVKRYIKQQLQSFSLLQRGILYQSICLNGLAWFCYQNN